MPVSQCCGHSWWEQWFGQVGAPWAGGHVGDGVGEEDPPVAASSAFSQLKLRAFLTQSLRHCVRPRCQVHLGSVCAASPKCRAALGAAAGPGCDSCSAQSRAASCPWPELQLQCLSSRCCIQTRLESHKGQGVFRPAVLKIRNSKFPQNLTKEGVISC